MDVLLAQDRGFERARLRSRFEAQVVAQPPAKAAIALEGLVSALQRVQREHLPTQGALAETVEVDRCSCMGQGRAEVELGQRQVGGVEPGSEDATLVAAAQI